MSTLHKLNSLSYQTTCDRILDCVIQEDMIPDLRLSQQFCWKLKSSGRSHYVDATKWPTSQRTKVNSKHKLLSYQSTQHNIPDDPNLQDMFPLQLQISQNMLHYRKITAVCQFNNLHQNLPYFTSVIYISIPWWWFRMM